MPAMDTSWNIDATYNSASLPSLVHSNTLGQKRQPLTEWAGQGTIAHVTPSAQKRFNSLSSEVHERLQRASTQLAAENSISQKLLHENESHTVSNKTSKSAVHQYELARFQLDRLPSSAPVQPAKLPSLCKVNNYNPEIPEETPTKNSYLDYLTSQIPSWEVSRNDLKAMEAFRVELTSIALKAVTEYCGKLGFSTDLMSISLQCFGSYRSGFALPNSDMDLLVIAERVPPSIKKQLPSLLTRAFLSVGFAPFLLPSRKDDKSAVLRVCQRPSLEFSEIIKWEYSSFSADAQLKAFTTFPLSCHSLLLRHKSVIHCNIYFDDTALLLCKTDLLRCYRVCDDRVYEMALFVKKWSNARQINEPYNGTLSSYGYILMLLHYLINVAHPAVVPNLQTCDIGTRELEWVQGCEVFFWRNQREIATQAERGALTLNHQTTASLLAEFFDYYSGPFNKSSRGGLKCRFNWAHEVVSISTSRPLLKMVKQWSTPYSRDKCHNKHLYFLSIEDPFETDHNVARTVDMESTKLIQAEFRRASRIISCARPLPGTDLEWQTDEGDICEDLFAERITVPP